MLAIASPWAISWRIRNCMAFVFTPTRKKCASQKDTRKTMTTSMWTRAPKFSLLRRISNRRCTEKPHRRLLSTEQVRRCEKDPESLKPSTTVAHTTDLTASMPVYMRCGRYNERRVRSAGVLSAAIQSLGQQPAADSDDDSGCDDGEDVQDIYVDDIEGFNPGDEEAFNAFMQDGATQQGSLLADIIMAKLQNKASAQPADDVHAEQESGMTDEMLEVYQDVGKLLSRCTGCPGVALRSRNTSHE